ncbi:sulfurtransferase [Filobacillus milosensis]|uniref:Sulfurtransferase n=1 Tax=Filobacillus milosensis TaxID=94137 RepID=A0A4Y8IT90_9BACI|nr:sulfurtransferase [Filobacillus milosensis]TFB24007.1 sulfurtransferase [Filobacillus milosensis]
MIISVKEAYDVFTNEKHTVFADCRFNLQDKNRGKKDYQNNHLPQAAYFDLEKELSGEVKEVGGRHPLPDLKKFTEALAERGIDHHTPVIIYDNNRAFASRMYWMMKLINHSKVYLMNGNIEDWKSNGYPTESHSALHSKSHYGEYNVDEELIANQNYVKKHKNKEDVVLVDSRSYERYIGKVEPIDHKAGHIPGAINLEWTKILDEQGRFKSKEELVKYFSDLNDKEEIIVYCGSGVTAAPNVIALWQAGFTNVRLYVGSFSDWISNDKNNIATNIK